MTNKLVSIAMATYNGEKYIKQQLESILNQTYNNLEVIICDDISKDKTVDIIKQYQKKDSRIKFYINKENLGFKKNFEKAISLCSGDFIALSDQDDIWKKYKIEKLVVNIKEYDLIHSASSLMDENSNIIAEKWLKQDNFKYSFEKLVFGNTITGCTVLFKKSLLKDFFPIPTGEKYHDWWLALLATKSKGITYINEPLVFYRQHSLQDTGAKVENKFQRLTRIALNMFNKKGSSRYQKSKQQILRLNSFLNERKIIFTEKEISIMKDAILYHKNYLEKFIHIQTFRIGLKYRKEIYFKKFILKNILRDLIG
jgi:glycosyltransferase involved in cell wall biosynthesis